MLFSKEEFDKYIIDNYENIENIPEDSKIYKDYCPKCKAVMGLEIEAKNAGATQRHFNRTVYVTPPNWDLPFNFVLKCPGCNSYKIMFLYRITLDKDNVQFYKLYTIPELEDYSIPELPNEYPSLKSTYLEAIKCLQIGAYKASATMFRRALQIIVRDILGENSWKLSTSLENLQNKPNKLGINLSNDFHEYSYIIKESGNQGAHPGQDIDLLEFTKEDAIDLRDMFFEIINELFIKPSLLKKAEENLRLKRKIK